MTNNDSPATIGIPTANKTVNGFRITISIALVATIGWIAVLDQ